MLEKYEVGPSFNRFLVDLVQSIVRHVAVNEVFDLRCYLRCVIRPRPTTSRHFALPIVLVMNHLSPYISAQLDSHSGERQWNHYSFLESDSFVF